jgi:hypothetical protein
MGDGVDWGESKGTAAQRRWIRRLHAVLQAMPEGLCLSRNQGEYDIRIYRQFTLAELAAMEEREKKDKLFEGYYLDDQGLLVAQVPWPVTYADPTFGVEEDDDEEDRS